MSKWKIPIHLNIRQKVVVGMTTSLLAVGFIGGISYLNLREIERKQHFVEVADDLSNNILEVRRYEKNYLLYGKDEDFQENQAYVQRALEVLTKIAPEFKNLQGAPQLNALHDDLMAYSKIMDQIHVPEGEGLSLTNAGFEEQLRERGKDLVGLSQRLVAFERERIFKIIKTLKTQLLSSLIIFLGLGMFIVFIVGRKIVTPLRVIERTTRRIAMGNFRPLPVQNSRDETQRVVEAFNLMVAELEKRQDQLVQAKKLSSLGILTSGIAHQLNNPLNNISTSCQILLEDLGETELEFVRKMLNNIEQEVYRARDIVRGLLEFSRVREFALVSTPLKSVVDRSIKLISSQIPPGIDIAEEIPDDLSLYIDPQRMQQVFLNLLMNSIQAIEPPGQIRIFATRKQDTKEEIIIVEDTGNGIPEKDLGRVFDPFFTTKEVGIGTGLGLSVVYGIIEKHRGSISVESKEGEGTRFIIRLPLAAEAEERESR